MKRGQQPEEANSLGAPRVFCPHTVSRDTKIPAAPELFLGLVRQMDIFLNQIDWGTYSKGKNERAKRHARSEYYL
jgi:hypothetical protein